MVDKGAQLAWCIKRTQVIEAIKEEYIIFVPDLKDFLAYLFICNSVSLYLNAFTFNKSTSIIMLLYLFLLGE